MDRICIVSRAALPDRCIVLRSSLILGPRTVGTCRKQSFVQFCDEKLATDTGADFFADEFRSCVAVADLLRAITWAISGGAYNAPGIYNAGMLHLSTL